MLIASGYRRAKAVTTSDTVDQVYGFTQKALYIGTTGGLKIDTPEGDTVTFTAVPVGMLYVSARRIYATGTAASNIVAVGD